MENFLEKIKAAGVIGAGGAGFPTHVKLGGQAQYVLVNAAECEPLLRVDQQLFCTQTQKILMALDKCVEAVGATSGIIGIKGKYKSAIEAIEKHLPNFPKLSYCELANVYPAGDEQYIVHALTGRIVPEGGIPLAVGCMVVNVETLLNIYEAFYEDKAVTEKYVTIAGAVANPITLKVPVGISVEKLIERAGGALVSPYKVIDGGPMMGKVLSRVKGPVKKTSKGYIVLPADHPLILNKLKPVEQVLKEAKTACCHCDLCTEVCPRYLQGHRLHPSKIMRIAGYGTMGDKNSSVEEAFLCCECGLCEQACIMNLQPWKVNTFLKGELGKAGIKNKLNASPNEVHPFKNMRGFPVKKLIYKLGLDMYEAKAALIDETMAADEVFITARQHIGAPSVLTVSKGEYVQKGQLVFQMAQGALGANIHASISGTVIEATQDHVVIKKD